MEEAGRIASDGSQCWTLREAWQRLIETEHRARGLAESTLRDHRVRLRAWEDWLSNHRSVETMVVHVSRTDLSAFRGWLQRKLGKIDGPPGPWTPAEKARVEAVAGTVNNYLGTVQQILRACEEEGVIGHAPRLKKLPVVSAGSAAKRKCLTDEEVGRLYAACQCVEWPNATALSVLRWRTAVVLYSCYGFRTQELIRYERENEPLRWANVLQDPACPENDGRDVWPHGWLRYVPQKQRSKKPTPVILPLHVHARRHLDAVRDDAEDDRAVFPWPCSSKSFAGQWAAIARAAGLEGVEINHLRKTAHTWHRVAGGKGIADMVTGHAARGVSDRHYNVEFGELVKHFATWAGPEAFGARLPDVRQRQLRLF